MTDAATLATFLYCRRRRAALPMQKALDFECDYSLSPAQKIDRDTARHVLDDLFKNAQHYNTTQAYRDLMDFVGKFRFYSPFNAMLIHTQLRGATYVAPAHRWLRVYDRRIKPGARPLVILQPMGPVMFVFDVADTDALPNARPLPREVERPFEVCRGIVGNELRRTIENASRDGIRVMESPAGSQSAGSIRAVTGKKRSLLSNQAQASVEIRRNTLRYELLLNSKMSTGARYATLVHELAHVYCGHLGTPSRRWWPDRRGLEVRAEEFEAESVCNAQRHPSG